MDTTSQSSMAKDPVCGMEVDPATTAFTYDYEGKPYAFCSRGCLLEFSDDPPHYLGPSYQPHGMDDLPV